MSVHRHLLLTQPGRSRLGPVLTGILMGTLALAGCSDVHIGIGGSDDAASATASATQDGSAEQPTQGAQSTEIPTPTDDVEEPGSEPASTFDPAAVSPGVQGNLPGGPPPGSTTESGSPPERVPDAGAARDSGSQTSGARPGQDPQDAAPADARGTVVEGSTIPHVGEAYRWNSGVTVHIAAPEPYQPSAAAAGTEGFTHFVRYQVTLTNRSALDFRLSDIRLRAQSGGQEGSQVFDSGRGINSLPAQELAQAETVSFPVVFGVPQPEGVVLNMTQSFEASDRVVFLPAQGEQRAASGRTGRG